MENEKAKVPPEVSSGEEEHLTDAQYAQDNPGQSGSVCLDEFQELAHSCVPPRQDESEGIEKLVHLYSSADPEKNASRTPLIRKYLQLGSAAAAAKVLKINVRTAQAHIAEFRKFVAGVLRGIEQARRASEEAIQANEERKEAKRKKKQRDFDSAWLQCKQQCPGKDKHRSESQATYDKKSQPQPEQIGTGCSGCPLSLFWAQKRDRAFDRQEEERRRGWGRLP